MAAACCTRTATRTTSLRWSTPSFSDQAIADNMLAAQDAALGRLLGSDFGGTLLGFVDRDRPHRRAALAPVAFDFWTSCARTSGSKNCGCSGREFQGLPK
jgi:hypothetical protein